MYSQFMFDLESAIAIQKHHYASRSRPFFDYLGDRAHRGFTPTQFRIYRDNFFFRTFSTIPSISKVVIAAAFHEDFETLADAGKNLADETGLGDPLKVHSRLLEDSHNAHAGRVFNLTGVRLSEAAGSLYLLPEAIRFKKVQASLYGSSQYAVVLAAAFAQETAADPMLKTFYEALFVPYRNCYSAAEFEVISEYFVCHLDGTEQRHSDDARRAVLRVCHDEADLHAAIEGMTAFWEAQSNLWNAMFEDFSRHESADELVPVTVPRPALP